jgi:Zn-dependent membrane protease YugP
MARLKIKEIEGDAPDVNSLFQNGGCDLASYLGMKAPQQKVPSVWIGIMAVVFFILTSCVWIDVFSLVWTKVAILGVFLLFFLILLTVHYNFKNWSLNAITGFAPLKNIRQ